MGGIKNKLNKLSNKTLFKLGSRLIRLEYIKHLSLSSLYPIGISNIN